MSVAATAAASVSRLRTLLGFLDQDQNNLSLLAEATAAALEIGDLAGVSRLIERYERLAPLPPAMLGLQGLAWLDAGDYAAAARVFEALLMDHPEDPTLAFNLAWSRGMLGDHQGALDCLPQAVAAGVPRAAALKVQALHHLGRVDEALAEGEPLARLWPEDRELAAALSVAATDAERLDLARLYAGRAGPHPDGLATLGALALSDDRVEEAIGYYDQALMARSDNARALLGKGLGLLVAGQGQDAAENLVRSAEIFGDHPGTWIAAGWAQFVNGDYAESRLSFERALAADGNFAECHGGLAVLEAVEGRFDNARQRAEVALRLDRACLSAALATSLILEHDNDPSKAARVRDIALNAPIGPEGRTLAQALGKLGAHRPSGRRV